ncbi:hypothetical protein BB561_005094 [Smittium simulii]|uniref:Uncharacterized protein n=1 Tax=Smittium simulii TaxID=133385 RepID=A0A2T9YCB3_9FUNG|nr:hypothetical protein BB561_005094 [Smittium simulii]
MSIAPSYRLIDIFISNITMYDLAGSQEKLEDFHVTARIPVTDLTVYPEYIEALPCIEEDFFRSLLTVKKRKNALYFCPKTSSMNYIPPPLNDSASSAVKKTDSALYGIQFHSAGNKAYILLPLFSDIAATVTQVRLDNVHKGMGLPETGSQKAESLALLEAPAEFGPKGCGQQHHQNRQLNFCGRGRGRGRSLIRDPVRLFNKRAPNYIQIGVGKAHRQPMGLEHSGKGVQYSIHEPSPNHKPGTGKKKFYEHQLTFFFTDDMSAQNSDANAPEYWNAIYGPTADVTSVAEKKKTDQGNQQSLDNGGDIPPVEASYIGSTTAKAGILQPTLYNSQEDWQPSTRLRLAETQYSRRRAELQD